MLTVCLILTKRFKQYSKFLPQKVILGLKKSLLEKFVSENFSGDVSTFCSNTVSNVRKLFISRSVLETSSGTFLLVHF